MVKVKEGIEMNVVKSEEEADLESEALDELMPQMSTRQYQMICKLNYTKN